MSIILVQSAVVAWKNSDGDAKVFGYEMLVNVVGKKMIASDDTLYKMSVEMAKNPVSQNVEGKSLPEMFVIVGKFAYNVMLLLGQLSFYFLMAFILFKIIHTHNESEKFYNIVFTIIILAMVQMIASSMVNSNVMMEGSISEKMSALNPVKGLVTCVVNLPQIFGNAYGQVYYPFKNSLSMTGVSPVTNNEVIVV